MIFVTEDDSHVELDGDGDGPLAVFVNHIAFVKINQGASIEESAEYDVEAYIQ